MRVAFLTRYSRNGASSRVRAMQFLPLLAQHGIEATLLPLHTPAYVDSLNAGRRDWAQVAKAYAARLRQARRLREFDLVWVEKELLPMLPYALDAWLLGDCPYVLDLDDAIFHNYDLSRSAPVRWLLGDKIDHLMRRARLVTVGNDYLGARARRAGARRVELLPSVIDLTRYTTAAPEPAARPLTIVWIGSPSTRPYLDLVAEPLRRVAARHPLRLHVIGAQAPQWEGVDTVSVPWSESTEVAAIAAGDIGIMPLHDTPWERGKCSFKLIQYMACGLPVIGSAVGANLHVVSEQEGFLVRDAHEWESALLALADSAALRQTLGRHGRQRVEQRFTVQVVGERLAQLLRESAAGARQ